MNMASNGYTFIVHFSKCKLSKYALGLMFANELIKQRTNHLKEKTRQLNNFNFCVGRIFVIIY